MADAATEARLLRERRDALLDEVGLMEARIEDLETNGHPETGLGDPDEARLMKEALKPPETTTAEPETERAVKPAAKRRTATKKTK